MEALAASARSLRLCALSARAPELRRILHKATRSHGVGTSAQARPMKMAGDLPGPSMSAMLYKLTVQGYANKKHILQCEQKRQYGPIWRSTFGPYLLINVASAEFIAQVIQQEGRYPVRVEMPHWKEYRDMRGQSYGLHVLSGAEWNRIRSVLNPNMLKPGKVKAFAPMVHQVVGDLLQRLEFLRCSSPDQATVSNMAFELYKFGFEATSTILFETRLGCLEQEIPPDTLKFIAAVNTMLNLTDVVLLLPRWSRNVLPYWKQFTQAWDDLYGVAQRLIDGRVAELAAQVRRGEPPEGAYLAHLLSSEKLSRAEVYITITELLLGGVDTTSNTLSWALYHLARDAGAQNQLHGEVTSVCPDGREPTTEDLSRMPFLKAVVKETLRLYPVVPGNGRYITENEVVVDDYWFPKKTIFHLCHYAVCHDEAEFPDAESFVPERWLRAGMPGSYQHHPYSFIPFGVGLRACLGKRLAEMEMYFTLSRVMQHYEIQPEVGATTVKPKTRVLMIPEAPINLRFLPRAM